jgi:hypothetical protein
MQAATRKDSSTPIVIYTRCPCGPPVTAAAVCCCCCQACLAAAAAPPSDGGNEQDPAPIILGAKTQTVHKPSPQAPLQTQNSSKLVAMSLCYDVSHHAPQKLLDKRQQQKTLDIVRLPCKPRMACNAAHSYASCQVLARCTTPKHKGRDDYKTFHSKTVDNFTQPWYPCSINAALFKCKLIRKLVRCFPQTVDDVHVILQCDHFVVQ